MFDVNDDLFEWCNDRSAALARVIAKSLLGADDDAARLQMVLSQQDKHYVARLRALDAIADDTLARRIHVTTPPPLARFDSLLLHELSKLDVIKLMKLSDIVARHKVQESARDDYDDSSWKYGRLYFAPTAPHALPTQQRKDTVLTRKQQIADSPSPAAARADAARVQAALVKNATKETRTAIERKKCLGVAGLLSNR